MPSDGGLHTFPMGLPPPLPPEARCPVSLLRAPPAWDQRPRHRAQALGATAMRCGDALEAIFIYKP